MTTKESGNTTTEQPKQTDRAAQRIARIVAKPKESANDVNVGVGIRKSEPHKEIKYPLAITAMLTSAAVNISIILAGNGVVPMIAFAPPLGIALSLIVVGAFVIDMFYHKGIVVKYGNALAKARDALSEALGSMSRLIHGREHTQ